MGFFDDLFSGDPVGETNEYTPPASGDFSASSPWWETGTETEDFFDQFATAQGDASLGAAKVPETVGALRADEVATGRPAENSFALPDLGSFGKVADQVTRLLGGNAAQPSVNRPQQIFNPIPIGSVPTKPGQSMTLWPGLFGAKGGAAVGNVSARPAASVTAQAGIWEIGLVALIGVAGVYLLVKG